ncbi:MAG: lamin tail domain-containing protein [Bacteroidetes bacterium]|nr:lamin tail domain-containing protein [Bacteroidota bacterium]
MKKIVLLILMLSVSSLFAQTNDIIISTYVEGSGNNKAIEIFNGTGTTVDLSNYRLEKDLNGSGNFIYYHNFTGTLNNSEVYVIAHPDACDEIKNVTNLLKQVITDFTGNDQIRLLKNGVEIDRIGVPGNVNFGYNKTFVRNSSVKNPLSGPQNPQTNGEWTEYPTNTFTYLGSHTFDNSGSGTTDLWKLKGSNIYRTIGNVGIGTTNPNAKLEIIPGGTQTTLNLGRISGQPTIKARTDAGGYLFMESNGGKLGLNWYASDNVIIANGGGNVGIGTTKPGNYKLYVNGQTFLSDQTFIAADKCLNFGKENSSSGFLRIFNSSGYYNTYADIKGNLYFRRVNENGGNGGATLGIQKNGTVTIGLWEKYEEGVIDTKGNKLSVNGGILCKNITIEHDVPNSDYVFENDYNLKSLDHVEKYIKENKHLPEVPSAKEFKENGYKVGEMDDLLLRKIEELTLYLIDLKKENEMIKKEIKELKK